MKKLGIGCAFFITEAPKRLGERYRLFLMSGSSSFVSAPRDAEVLPPSPLTTPLEQQYLEDWFFGLRLFTWSNYPRRRPNDDGGSSKLSCPPPHPPPQPFTPTRSASRLGSPVYTDAEAELLSCGADLRAGLSLASRPGGMRTASRGS